MQSQFFDYDDKLYIVGNDGSAGSDYELFIYDPAQPMGAGNPVKIDINAGIAGSSPQFFTELGGKIYFAANDNSNGRELHVFDPSQPINVGTNPSIVSDFNPGPGSGNPFDLVAVNDKLYYSAFQAAEGVEMRVYDPSQPVSGTNPSLVADIRPSVNSSSPGEYTVLDDKIYFKANDGVNGSEAWVFDTNLPISLGTNPLMIEFNSGSGNAFPSGLLSFNNSLFLTTFVSTGEVWILDSDNSINIGTNPQAIKNDLADVVFDPHLLTVSREVTQ